MSEPQVKEQVRGKVRLRMAERFQYAFLPGCLDDLVKRMHPVRTVMAVVEKLDVSAFSEPIEAREGVAGRDATDPQLLVGLWLYASVRGIGSARELARRCEESAPFQWICGGVTVNHRLLSDFRTDHGQALDKLLTQLLATLVDKNLVKVSRISQDGVRVRVSAGSKSFRREERLQELLRRAEQHVSELKQQLESPTVLAQISKRKKAAQLRAAEERQQRVEEAVGQLPELKQKQAEAAKRAGQGKCGDRIRAKQPRVSTTDGFARVMKMANGGFSPAVNVQVASDPESRAILAVEVSNEGSDSAGLSEPMRRQVEQRTGGKVEQHLLDGGYLRQQDIVQAHQQGVELYIPGKPARNLQNQGHELEVKANDSEPVRAWKLRMSSEQGKQIYQQRASTSEPINAELRAGGLNQFTVRGQSKIKCAVLWTAIAYNVMHFSAGLLS